MAVFEYFQRLTVGDRTTHSTGFVYKMARALHHEQGDVGTSLRSALKAMRRFGVPDQTYWPESEQDLDADPSAFVFGCCQKEPPIVYFHPIHRTLAAQQTVDGLRAYLAGGIPIMFTFSVPDTLSASAQVDYRGDHSLIGGQAVVAIGYNDRYAGPNGAFLIRSSWGMDWGDNGYGWLSYSAVAALATDFWVMLRSDWVCHEALRRPSLIDKEPGKASEEADNPVDSPVSVYLPAG